MSDMQSAAGGHSTNTSPVIAALISLIVPGIGMIVAGEPVKGRGIYWLVGTIIAAILLTGFTVITLGFGVILWLAWPVVHLAAAADSYVQVDKIYNV